MCNNYFPLNALYLWRQLYCAKNMIFDIEEKKKLRVFRASCSLGLHVYKPLNLKL